MHSVTFVVDQDGFKKVISAMIASGQSSLMVFRNRVRRSLYLWSVEDGYFITFHVKGVWGELIDSDYCVVSLSDLTSWSCYKGGVVERNLKTGVAVVFLIDVIEANHGDGLSDFNPASGSDYYDGVLGP